MTKPARFGLFGYVVGVLLLISTLTAAAQNPKGLRLKPLPATGSTVTTNSIQEGDRFGQTVAPMLRERLASIHARNQLSSTQKATFKSLYSKSKGDVEIRLRGEAGTLRFIRGAVLEKAAEEVAAGEDRDEKTARAFLRANRALLRIDDPDLEFELTKKQRDELQRRHLRFAQRQRGLPVWPADVIVHLDPEGNVDLMDGAYVPTPREVGTEPVIDENSAIARGRLAVPNGAAGTASRPELIIYAPGDRRPRLAWKFELPVSAGFRWLVVIDAMNGATLTYFNQIQDANVAGSGTDLFNQTRPLNVWQQSSTYYLVDTSKSMFNPSSSPPSAGLTRGGIVIQDARNQPPSSQASNFPLPTLFSITSSSATSGWLRDGVSAAFGLSQTYDYYLQRHGRNSIDGEGGTVYGVVRLGLNYFNAYWDGTQMVFGDAEPFVGSLDVVGHELTHGVTGNSANLLYQNQSGALNEAMSDIFGEMIEARTFGGNDWLVGTELSAPLRSMSSPEQFGHPSRLSDYFVTSSDNGGVHINSGIINHAYYLLAYGLNSAIGNSDAERIFYRALTIHLVANSDFTSARLAGIQSAKELFGEASVQAQKVAEAFDAVEVYDGSGSSTPPEFPPVSGPDSTVFVFYDSQVGAYFLGRREAALGDDVYGSYLSTYDVSYQRPSVSGDGTFAVFVDSLNDVCLVPTDGSRVERCFGAVGQVYSVGASPDGRRYAFVLQDLAGNPLNSITVVSVGARTQTRTYQLLSPAIDGVTANTIINADAMVFTGDGRFIIFDAFNRVNFADGSQLGLWSIYALDLVSGQTFTIVPPIEGYDIGYPALSKTSDNYVTFDVVDTDTGDSTIFAGNLNTGDIQAVGSVPGEYGVPGYSGNDSAIIYSYPDFTPTGFSLYRQGLSADRITPSGAPTLWLEEGDFGVIYRRGLYKSPIYDLAVAKLSAPKKINLTVSARTVLVKVTIQNRGPNMEIINNLTELSKLVRLNVQSLGTNCPAPTVILLGPAPLFLTPKKKATILFAVTFNCANDPQASTSSANHSDYRLVATVDHDSFDGMPDTHVDDDTCPRPALLGGFDPYPDGKVKDLGCGRRRPEGTLGAPVLVDVIVK